MPPEAAKRYLRRAGISGLCFPTRHSRLWALEQKGSACLGVGRCFRLNCIPFLDSN